MYYLVGYGAIGKEAKIIPLPNLSSKTLIEWYIGKPYTKFPITGNKFDLIHQKFGISLDRLIFDWFIEYRDYSENNQSHQKL